VKKLDLPKAGPLGTKKETKTVLLRTREGLNFIFFLKYLLYYGVGLAE